MRKAAAFLLPVENMSAPEIYEKKFWRSWRLFHGAYK